MNLEVGMYVRTTTGRIFKIIEVENKNVFYCCNSPELQWQEQTFIYSKRGLECSNNIVKASNNIIDLIEVGDYVNGYRVDFVENIDSPIITIKKVFCEEYTKDLYSKTFNIKDIKSIVTKEQFESMKYSLEG